MNGINKLNFSLLNKVDKSHRIRSMAMRSLSGMPDEDYLKLMVKLRTGKTLNLDNPSTYLDKLNWLKLHDKHDEYTQYADKLAVRSIIKAKVGEQYLTPLLGHWENFDDIDFDKLPNRFVLKCNHDSGSIKVIKDKSKLTRKDVNNLKRHFNRHLSSNPFFAGREYVYKNIKPQILAEEYLDAEESTITDYKFFCFNGEPKFVNRVGNRFSGQKRDDYYDMNFNPIEDISNTSDCPRSIHKNSKPECFEEMKTLAATLSEGMKHVRLDLCLFDNKIYFGEFTFFHCGGFCLFKPDEWEYKMGEWIKIEG